MRPSLMGILCGCLVGIIDVTPMIFQGLSIYADLSAFSMWVIIGFLVSAVDLDIRPVLKGITISLICLTQLTLQIPVIIIIAENEPVQIVVFVVSMTTMLGSILGYLIDKFSPNKKINIA